MNYNPQQHWEKVYNEKGPAQVSWYQITASVSLALIEEMGINQMGRVIDVGAGASVLADKLLEEGFKNIAVLDISAKALQYSKERLGEKATGITWIEEDVTKFEPPQQYDLWHDRAVFHFLTDATDRRKYVETMTKAVKPNGYVIIATFAMEGPPKCSGLDVERYNSEKLSKEIGNHFVLVKSAEETHMTPWHSEQKFIYCVFKVQSRSS